MTRLGALLFAVVVVVGTSFAHASDRIALVIGNGSYAHASTLANPINDATDLSQTLEQVGFEVRKLTDTDYNALRIALGDFRRDAANAEFALIYFAGHGIEISRENYLLPVDARLDSVGDVAFQAIPLDMLRAAAAPASTISLVIVDACRNNPFLDRIQTATRSISRGLSLVSPRGQNRLVAYAAREGTVASDGYGRNSPYAEALIEEIATPGIEMGKVFRRVRDRVLEATDGEQEPVLYGSLSSADYFFVPPDTTPEPQSVTEDIAQGMELEFWRAIKDSDRVADYEDYLRLFPDGLFVPLAVRRLAELTPRRPEPEAEEPVVAMATPRLSDEEPNVGRAAPAAPASKAPDATGIKPDQVKLAGLALVPTLNKTAATGQLDATEAPRPAPTILDPEGAPEVDPDRVPVPEARLDAREPDAPTSDSAGPSDPTDTSAPPETEVAAIEPTRALPQAVDALPTLARTQVRDLQVRLTLLGHNTRGADGLIGPNTRRAVSAFQSASGLEANGEFTSRTVERLEAAVPDQKVAAYHARIEEEAAARARARAEQRRQQEERARQQAARQPAAVAPTRPEPSTPAGSEKPATAAVTPTRPETPAAPKPNVTQRPAEPAAATSRPVRIFGAEPGFQGRGGK